MVFSFAAMWGRALGLLKGPQPPPEDPFTLVEAPLVSKQKPLWEALQTSSEEGFLEFFLLSQPASGLFELWQRIFRELCDGNHVPWPDVRQAAQDIADIQAQVISQKARGRSNRTSLAPQLQLQQPQLPQASIASPAATTSLTPKKRNIWNATLNALIDIIDPLDVLGRDDP